MNNMLFTQFNWDDALAVAREEFYEDGLEDGMKAGLLQGQKESLKIFLSAKGTVPEKLKAVIERETNLELLQEWVKLAASAESVEKFIEKTGITTRS